MKITDTEVICDTPTEVLNAIILKYAEGKTLVVNFENGSELFSAQTLPEWLVLDTSKVTNMRKTFFGAIIKCDLSRLNTSNVKNMDSTFNSSKYAGDLTFWDLSNTETTANMFAFSDFRSPSISCWKFPKNKNMAKMFAYSKYDQDISSLDCLAVRVNDGIFTGCPIPEAFKPKFK